jgi:hypothetical protein
MARRMAQEVTAQTYGRIQLRPGKVIRTNAIGFTDDLNSRAWSSGYYVENAIYRVKELNPSWDFVGYAYSPRSKVREAWNEAFKELNAFVTGTISGTTTNNPTPPTTDQSP